MSCVVPVICILCTFILTAVILPSKPKTLIKYCLFCGQCVALCVFGFRFTVSKSHSLSWNYASQASVMPIFPKDTMSSSNMAKSCCSVNVVLIIFLYTRQFLPCNLARIFKVLGMRQCQQSVEVYQIRLCVKHLRVGWGSTTMHIKNAFTTVRELQFRGFMIYNIRLFYSIESLYS